METRNRVVEDGKNLIKKAINSLVEMAIKFEAFSQKNKDDDKAKLMHKLANKIAKCFDRLTDILNQIVDEV